MFAIKSFKCFKFRANLKVPPSFLHVKTVEIKSPDSIEASFLPFRRDLISLLIISCSSKTLWEIWGTLGFWEIFKKLILSQFSTISSIMESLVMSFQFFIKFWMLLATNSVVFLLLLTTFIYCNLVSVKSIALLSCPFFPLSRASPGRLHVFWNSVCRCWWLGLFEWLSYFS